MKKRILNTASLAVMLSLLPLTGGFNLGAAEPPSGTAIDMDASGPDSFDESAGDVDTTNTMPAPPPDIAQKSAPADVPLSAAAAEVAKLAQAGVSEAVMLSFVNNSTSGFNLGSQQIIYLNDIGVPDSVVNAMIQRDQTFKSAASSTTSSPGYGLVSLPPATEETDAPPAASPPPTEPLPVVVDDNYFYSSLSPYGTWVNVDGYGWCWQPTVVIVNHGWQPYCDRGRWIYTDCGWYWYSDYSWGSVAFHYGRWFNDPHRGWCWYPTRTWGPAWVSWRYDNSYCGWAPLSPAAHFSFGVGLTFGSGFGGLSAGAFTFVPWGSFCDARPYQHRVSRDQFVAVYNSTTPVNNNIVVDNHHRVVNRGIAPARVTGFTHQQIPKYTLRDRNDWSDRSVQRAQVDHANHTVFDGHLPTHAGSVAPVIGNNRANGTRFDNRPPANETPAATVTRDARDDRRKTWQPGVSTPGNHVTPVPATPVQDSAPRSSHPDDHHRGPPSNNGNHNPASTPAVQTPVQAETPRTFTPPRQKDFDRNVPRSAPIAPAPAPAPAPRYVAPPQPSYTPPPAPPAPRQESRPPTYSPPLRQENRAPAYSPPPSPPPQQAAPAKESPPARSAPDSGRKGHDRNDK